MQIINCAYVLKLIFSMNASPAGSFFFFQVRALDALECAILVSDFISFTLFYSVAFGGS